MDKLSESNAYLDAQTLHLTHFGQVTDIAPHFEGLENRLIEW